MELKRMNNDSMPFVYEMLKELRGTVSYDYKSFVNYVEATNLLEDEKSEIWIAYERTIPLGILSCNQFSMPRYLGIGLEIEEVVITPSYQKQGYGKEFLNLFLKSLKERKSYAFLRKITIKTDDQEIAGKLYKHYFIEQDYYVYTKTINYL